MSLGKFVKLIVRRIHSLGHAAMLARELHRLRSG